ncbi:MAG: FAD-dependent monooxygenase [Brachybacterium tyrofermentans]
MTGAHPVLVVGAGPAGLTAALALRSLGIEVTVLTDEPEDRIRPGSRALYVHRDSLRTLERIHPGLGRDIAAHGIQWTGVRTRWRNRVVYARDFAPGTAEISGQELPAYSSLRQVDTERYLFDACQSAGVRFSWNAPVNTVTATCDDVQLALTGGRILRARYVVGADGARSTVRQAIDRTMVGGRSEAYHVVVDLADDPDRPDPAHREFTYHHPGADGRHALVVPFAGGRQVDVQCRPGEDPDGLLTDDALSRWLPRMLDRGYLDRIMWRSRYPFLQHVADSFIDEHRRVLLIGEASHLFAPFGARGMNSAIADADRAATAIGTALAAINHERARGAVDDFDRLRRIAAVHNRDAAAAALHHMRPTGWGAKLRVGAAAQGARFVPALGRWLEKAPYGPRTAATPLSTY